MPRVNLAVEPSPRSGNERPDQTKPLDPADIHDDQVTDVRLGMPSPGEDRLISELAASMQEVGQAQAVLVRLDPSGGYRIIAGRRRVAAAREAGMKVNAVVIEADDDQARRLAFEENWRRKQMSPIQFALNIKAYRDRALTRALGEGAAGMVLPVSAIAKYFQVSPAHITQTEKLLTLPPDVQAKVHTGALAVDAAFVLAKVPEESRTDVMGLAEAKAADEPPTKTEVKQAAKTEKVAKKKLPPLTPEQKKNFKDVKDNIAKARVPKVQAKHVLAAARETETLGGTKIRNRNEILTALRGLSTPEIPEVMCNWIDYFTETYATGDAANETGLRNRWNEIAYAVEKGEAKSLRVKPKRKPPAPKKKK